MSNEIQVKCGICLFYAPNKDRHGAEGGCICQPPNVFPMQNRDLVGQVKINWITAPHPAVQENNLCGHFRPIQEVKSADNPLDIPKS